MSTLARENRTVSTGAKRLWLGIAAVLLAAVAIFTAINMRDYFTVPEVQLPDLIGVQQEDAAAVLRRHGLEPVSFVEYVEGATPGAVTSQSPAPGAVVKKGRTVHLGINTVAAEARVPDLLGMREVDAKQRAQELNLPLGTITYEASERPAGTVIAQTPEGGIRFGIDERLRLVISRGQDLARVELPDLKGVDVKAAQAELARLGFNQVETVPSSVSFTEARAVVGMAPPAGTEVVQSTPIALHYALSSRNVVSVPEVVGYPQWRAQLSLRAAQLAVGQITYVQDPSKPEGVVAVQPTGYTLPGTPVLLTINGEPNAFAFPDSTSPLPGVDDVTPGVVDRPPGAGLDAGQADRPAGPADGARQVPFTFDPTFMGVRRLLEEPYQLRLVITDDRGERTVLDRSLAAGEILSTTVDVYGEEAMLQTYIDDVFFQAWRP
ncbi:MAG TPA: PASTA domain-containing protein [Trueperaceae bacterium]|nr:PASTA domain-containing protein [Trueperaceae bacterium]